MTEAELGRLKGITEKWARDQPAGLWEERVTETKVVVTLIDREYNRLQAEAEANRIKNAVKRKRKTKKEAAAKEAVGV